MSLTPDATDKLLVQWHHRLTHATENLLALEDLLILKRMEGRDGFSPLILTGITAERVTPTLATIRELFTQLATLTDLVQRAEQLRQSPARFLHFAETFSTIENLLNGPVIPLPAIEMPLASRGLLSAAQNQSLITAEDLLSRMLRAFESVRDVLLAVESAWSEMETEIDAALTKVTALRERANSLPVPAPIELETAETYLKSLTERLKTDPIGAHESPERNIHPLLTAARERLEQDAAQHIAADQQLKAARQLWEQLLTAHRECDESLKAVQNSLDATGSCCLPLPPATFTQLADWLNDIHELANNGKWQAFNTGIQRWTVSVNDVLAQERASNITNRNLRTLPDELSGRLRVLKIRAAKRLATPASDDPLPRLIAQAEQVLSERPLPINRAERLIFACEERLRSGK